MRLVRTIAELRAELGSSAGPVGFVPTMGYLHRGHASLLSAARDSNALVVASIFVNPLQFAPTEDLGAYPRDLDRDSELAAHCGVDVLFVPDVAEMYPRPVLTTVSVDGISHAMEGASRPTHFAGVATVVAKLFAIVGPCRAYFGEKDYQQLAVVARMASDLSLPVEVVGCPTVREPDGLALSSRNVYLTAQERAAAPVLHRALRAAAAAVMDGEHDAERVRSIMSEIVIAAVDGAGLGHLDYVEVAHAETLAPETRCSPATSRLFGAVRFSSARLIDNVAVAP